MMFAMSPLPRTFSARCLCLVLAALLLAPSAAHRAEAADVPFPDMVSSWYRYREGVSYLKEKGTIEGYPDGNFRPQTTVNRAEMLKLIFRARAETEPITAGGCFADVPADAWFAPYVCAAARRNIVRGYGSGSSALFKPEQPVVFAEAVKMVLQAYGKDINEPPSERWYKPYTQELERIEILPEHAYVPGDALTRERAADLITRYVRHEDDRVIPNLSPGCGKSRADTSTTLTVNGLERSFLLTIPRRYVEHDPAPLIVAFHGRTNSNEQVRAYFGLDREATDYFVAYPAAIKKDNGSFSWSDPGNKALEWRDIAFFDAIVEKLGNSYCIDLDKIYVVGHSLGASMASTVACARGGVVRASAVVGGSAVVRNCLGPAAALIINNHDDTLSPHASAEAMRDIRIAENGADASAEKAEPASLSCVRYASVNGNPVDWCPHTIDREGNSGHYPHLWPREAARTMVKFFQSI